MTRLSCRLPMFPLSTVLFPRAPLPLHVFEPRYRALVAHCLRDDGEFGVVLISRGSEVGGGDQRVAVGTAARIEQATPLPDGRWAILARGLRRVRVVEWLDDDPYPLASVEYMDPAGGDAPEAAAPGARVEDLKGTIGPALTAVRRARALLSETGRGAALAADPWIGPDLEAAAWQLAAMTPVTPLDAQRLLEITRAEARLGEVAELATALADDLCLLLADGQG